ncbi:MAG TPA: secondary thiamine-phosphate synthase enzyme YjbQ, partial [Gemmatimonadales bacterium]|nr:secondary thiamine-phosphate synthase enzyme YjbQ [Gemmatimonadales bacterium]
KSSRKVAVTLTTHNWTVRLPAEFGYADITPQLQKLVGESGVQTGVLTVQLLGSTGALTTIEYEPGALSDLRRTLEILAPVDGEYDHNARWGDGNGFSHVRSALLKTSLSLPIVDGELAVGTWQQVVAINLDNRERVRELVAVLMGSD